MSRGEHADKPSRRCLACWRPITVETSIPARSGLPWESEARMCLECVLIREQEAGR